MSAACRAGGEAGTIATVRQDQLEKMQVRRRIAKNLNDHPPGDVPEQGSRLMKAIENLRQARTDVAQEEDNPQARELKHRTLAHIDRALQAAQGARR